MAMVAGANRSPPQLYSGLLFILISYRLIYELAPDPEEDPEAQKAMEHLATLAAQVNYIFLFNSFH